MENLADSNKFIELLENLYNAKYLSQDEPVDTKSRLDEEMEKINVETKRRFSLFKKTIEEIKDTNKDKVGDAYYSLLSYLNENVLSKPNQDFWTLWKICQFIRWSEKVLIYNNDPDTKFLLCVDSNLKDESEHDLTISGYNYRIFLKLQLINKINVKFSESSYNQVITILVTRDFGHRMSSKYIVIDGELDLDDDSDLYLINQINKDINNAIQNTFVSIVENILSVPYMESLGLRFDYKNYYSK